MSSPNARASCFYHYSPQPPQPFPSFPPLRGRHHRHQLLHSMQTQSQYLDLSNRDELLSRQHYTSTTSFGQSPLRTNILFPTSQPPSLSHRNVFHHPTFTSASREETTTRQDRKRPSGGNSSQSTVKKNRMTMQSASNQKHTISSPSIRHPQRSSKMKANDKIILYGGR